jgi:hypothetical protein
MAGMGETTFTLMATTEKASRLGLVSAACFDLQPSPHAPDASWVQVGRIIGRAGSTIKELETRAGVRIQVRGDLEGFVRDPPALRRCTITANMPLVRCAGGSQGRERAEASAHHRPSSQRREVQAAH